MRGKRIVLKFGTGILTRADGAALEPEQFRRLGADVAEVVKAGNECLIVSSGAVAAGMHALGIEERPEGLAARQACAAIGQTKLMQQYESVFDGHGVIVAQLLLTHGDIDSRIRYVNAKSTLECIFDVSNVVPIVNENDSVAVEELKFGDNDRLSAEVAMLAGADLLILLTSVDGLMDHEGGVIREVDEIAQVERFARSEKGQFSVGGMVSKLQAVKIAVDAGIETYIASGRAPGVIAAAVAGEAVGTHFSVKRNG